MFREIRGFREIKGVLTVNQTLAKDVEILIYRLTEDLSCSKQKSVKTKTLVTNNLGRFSTSLWVNESSIIPVRYLFDCAHGQVIYPIPCAHSKNSSYLEIYLELVDSNLQNCDILVK